MKSKPPSELDILWARLFFIQLGLFTLLLFGGICINWGIAIFKALGWFDAGIDFWNVSRYSWPLWAILIVPVGWAIFGYFYAVRRAMIVFYESVLKNWNHQWARAIAADLWMFFQKNPQSGLKTEIFSGWQKTLKMKVNLLPKLIVWIISKLLNGLSLVEVIGSMDSPEFRKSDQIDMQNQIEAKLNTFAEDRIQSKLPRLLYVIFVVNAGVICWILIV